MRRKKRLVARWAVLGATILGGLASQASPAAALNITFNQTASCNVGLSKGANWAQVDNQGGCSLVQASTTNNVDGGQLTFYGPKSSTTSRALAAGTRVGAGVRVMIGSQTSPWYAF